MQALRRVANSCGVIELVRDDAKKAAVEAMAAAVQRSSVPKARAEAAEALTAYHATFASRATPALGQTKEAGGHRVRGSSLLLTYNWDFWGKDFRDGTPRTTSKKGLWDIWCKWKRKKETALATTRSTSTMEESLRSELAGRVHWHWKIDLQAAVDEPTTDIFAFHGIRPDARSTVVASTPTRNARGANFAEASNRAHFYVWVWKKGTLYSDTNWYPFDNYKVVGAWVDALWQQGKLENQIYGKLALRLKVGYATRRRDLDAVVVAEKEVRVNKKMAAVATEQKKLLAPFRDFPQVRAWEDTFLLLNFRWKLLVLVADSASGKSNYAEHLFSNALVLTVEDAKHLDLKDLDVEIHDGLVLDNVNSWQQLLSWRAVLQARNAKSRGGQSATNVYSYPQYLYGVPIVATIDLDAPDAYVADAASPKRSKWLLKNAVFVRLGSGEAFYDTARVPGKKVPNTFSLFAETVKRKRLSSPQGGPLA